MLNFRTTDSVIWKTYKTRNLAIADKPSDAYVQYAMALLTL